MSRNQRTKWAVLLALLMVMPLAGCRMLRKFEQSQVYHPTSSLLASASDLRRPSEEVLIPVEADVRIHAWFFPASSVPTNHGKVFLVCHGNAGNISHRLDLCRLLLETGSAVMVFDYRGYGRSSGTPSEEGTYRDAQAAHKWLREKGFSESDIICYGESLGGAVATELAMREPAAGLVLQSTFTSIPAIGAELLPWLPVRWISTIKYDTLSKLPELKVPVLVIHSRRDALIGFHHAERNFAKANQPKFLFEISGDHNDGLWESRDEMLKALNSFLSQFTPQT